jgi:hypothetical protein
VARRRQGHQQIINLGVHDSPTLQATALVHDAYARLVAAEPNHLLPVILKRRSRIC